MEVHMSQPPSLLTVGEIARQLQEPIHRIEYVIRSRGVQPIGWAGHARVFAPASLDRIDSELDRMDRDRVSTMETAND
jgi:hypothetical protein